MKRPSRIRRHRRIILALVALLALGLLVSPYLIAHTPLRDSIIRGVINDPDWAISTKSASFGWLSPLTISGLEMSNSDDSVRLQVNQLVADRPWFSLWFSPEDLGPLRIDRPHLIVVADRTIDGSDGKPAHGVDLPNFAAGVSDASLKVYVQSESGEPAIDVAGVDVNINVVGLPGDKQLNIDRLSVFERQPLTPEICNHGLQLIAPVLDGEVSITGTVSLEASDLAVPIDAYGEAFAKRLQLRGSASLDDCQASLTNPVTLRLVAMFAELLNLGQIPEKIRLTDETQLRFEVRDGRIFHESTAILIPEVLQDFEFRSSGLVSLDETIDLAITARLPVELLGDGPLAKQVSQTPIEVAVTGTISEPVLRLPKEATWHTSLQDTLNDENLSPSDQQLAAELRRLIDSLRESL